MQQRTRNAIAALVLPLVAACAVVVDPEAFSIRCAIDPKNPNSDPCVTLGQQCMDGECRSCDQDAVELCNGRDDDCDAEIDEGQDTDQDGFTWCGGGRVELADCIDSDGRIHPGDSATGVSAPEEECDGKDNDCDDRVDETRDCRPMTSCIETGCPEEQRCDTETGRCFLPREVGSGCTSDVDCKGGFCLRPGSFGLLVSLTDNRCASACCSDADCGEGGTCVIADSGARACLPKNIVGRGARKRGERCLRDAECESGLCARSVCQTRCYQVDACPGEACRLSEGSTLEPRRFVCAMPDGPVQAGEACSLTGCVSNYCDELLCGTPCARDSDCDANAYCRIVDVRSGGVLGPPAGIALCKARPPGTTEGAPLEQLCCSNVDCGEGALCAPSSAGGTRWHMTCRPESS